MADDRYRIAHPTDFSEIGGAAFAHALKLALILRADFHLLHVSTEESGRDYFPAVRDTLTKWGLISADAPRSAVEKELGVGVHKVNIHDRSAAEGVLHYIEHSGAELVVMATHGRDGLDRVIHGSVSEDIAALTEVPVLFVPMNSRGFVDARTGAFSLKRIVVPVASKPDPAPALHVLASLLADLGVPADGIDLIHAGTSAPAVHLGAARGPASVRLVEGDIIDAILDAAEDADLVVMPTEQRNSVLDTLRGTTTERVIRRATCPVLAIPA